MPLMRCLMVDGSPCGRSTVMMASARESSSRPIYQPLSPPRQTICPVRFRQLVHPQQNTLRNSLILFSGRTGASVAQSTHMTRLPMEQHAWSNSVPNKGNMEGGHNLRRSEERRVGKE